MQGRGCFSTAAVAILAGLFGAAGFQSTVVNPLLASGADPCLIFRDGYYYYTQTGGNAVTIWRSDTLGDLAHADHRVVWRPSSVGPYSSDIWSPQIEYLSGKWYIYFAADSGTNQTHRLWVLESSLPDPLHGKWLLRGKLTDSDDKWAIDPFVFRYRDRLYALWSGWPGDQNGVQNIYIAEMSSPTTIKSRRVMISTPRYDWEKIGDIADYRRSGNPPHVDVNEGPRFLTHGDSVFVIYSASGCWTDQYSLGMLSARADADILKASSWTKSPHPVFRESPAAHAYGTGRASFFESPDGTENWMVYHANSESHEGCGQARSPRAQRFTWNDDGTPNFGTPVQVGKQIPAPAGERVHAGK